MKYLAIAILCALTVTGCQTGKQLVLPKGSTATITVSDTQSDGWGVNGGINIPLDGGGK